MPRKPKIPCRYPGCAALSDESYCPLHRKLVVSQYDRYRRKPEAKKRYVGEWRAIRKRYITAHPLCEKCYSEGRITAATEVHHIVPLGDGGTSDDSNLMALCKPCHSRITVTEGRRWGKHE